MGTGAIVVVVPVAPSEFTLGVTLELLHADNTTSASTDMR